MPTWKMPNTSTQPIVSLVRWTVVRLKLGEIQGDFAYGWDVLASCGRVSSVIKSVDQGQQGFLTRTGRLYRLVGPSTNDLDGEYVFRQKYFHVISSCEVSDVSHEYQAQASSTTPDPAP